MTELVQFMVELVEIVQVSYCLYFVFNTQSMQQNLLGVSVGSALTLKVVYEQLFIGMKVLHKHNMVKETSYGA